MNRYSVKINTNPAVEVNASSASVAVHRAMDRFSSGEFNPYGTVYVKLLGKLQYDFDVTAEVPFDYGENGKGYKRETVLTGYPTAVAADFEAERLKLAQPTWRFIQVVKRNKK